MLKVSSEQNAHSQSQGVMEYVKLMRLHRPVGILLLYIPCLAGMAASKNFDLFLAFKFLIGAIFMRSAGCIVNDFLDRKFDAHVKRTKDRPFVKGTVSKKGALALALGLCLSSLLLIINFSLTSQLMCVFAFFLAVSYPLMKRITYWPQLYLGLTFNIGFLIAWCNTHPLSFKALCIYLALICWTLVYDTLYAVQDRDDDLLIGVRSTAILFKDHFNLAIISVSIAMLLFLILAVGSLNVAFLLGFFPLMFLTIVQLWQIRHTSPDICFLWFQRSHWFGWLITILLAVA